MYCDLYLSKVKTRGCTITNLGEAFTMRFRHNESSCCCCCLKEREPLALQSKTDNPLIEHDSNQGSWKYTAYERVTTCLSVKRENRVVICPSHRQNTRAFSSGLIQSPLVNGHLTGNRAHLVKGFYWMYSTHARFTFCS